MIASGLSSVSRARSSSLVLIFSGCRIGIPSRNALRLTGDALSSRPRPRALSGWVITRDTGNPASTTVSSVGTANGGVPAKTRFIEPVVQSSVVGRSSLNPRRPSSAKTPWGAGAGSASHLYGFCFRRKDFLSSAHCGTECHWFSGHARNHVFQRGECADRIEIVVIAEMRHAEELAFHLSLPVGDDGVERVVEFFNDGAGIDSRGRTDRGHGGSRGRGR